MKPLKTFFKLSLLKPLSLIGLRITRIPTNKEISIREEKERQALEYKLQQKQEFKRLHLWLSNMEIKTVLDIGANTGQFASKILEILPDIDLYCFEPIAKCYEELKQNICENTNVKFFNFALGNQVGEQTINLNEYSPSSSLLEMNNLHKEAFTFTEKSNPEKIYIKKLDHINEELVLSKPLLIKIDVQGF